MVLNDHELHDSIDGLCDEVHLPGIEGVVTGAFLPNLTNAWYSSTADQVADHVCCSNRISR